MLGTQDSNGFPGSIPVKASPTAADLVEISDAADGGKIKYASLASLPLGGSGAPVGATYITQTPNGTLTNEQALSLLTTGLMKSTTVTGVVSIAVAGTDYVAPATTITINGTANEITSSAGAQDLSANRTWTLSLPNALTFTGKTVTGGALSGVSATTFTFTTGTIGTAVTAVTQVGGTNNTTLATTQFVTSAIGAGGFVTSVSGTANRISSTGGATPVIDIDAAYVGQTSITTVGTIATGTWNATNIALNKGGTNAALTASNGGIFYSTATAGAILSGTATARQMLQSGATAAPAWSTATWPATTSINRILYSSAANVVGEITTANSGLLVTDGSGVPSISSTIPNGVIATTQTINDNSTKVATTAYVNDTVKLGQTNVAANSNTTFTQNIATNQYFKITVSSNCTLGFTFNASLVQSMCLQLINAGAFTVTWSSVLWAGGAAPTFTAAGTDMVVIWHNGDNIVYGALIGKAFA